MKSRLRPFMTLRFLGPSLSPSPFALTSAGILGYLYDA